MKSMKKLVLVGLVLLASVIVLVGCDTNAGDTPKSTNKAEDLTLTIKDASGSPMSVTLEDTDSDGYYEIGTADKLYAFAAAVNDKGLLTINGKLTSSIVVNETVLDEQGKLSKNVTFRSWTPIGNGDTPYTGIFDGAGYTISGLYFNDTNTSYAGLFGNLREGGSVQNLGVLDSYFCGGEYVGGIVGYNGGAVSNCYNKGDVIGTSEGSSCFVGGVVGDNWGQVTNCYNTGDVSGTSEGSYCYVGGVVGFNYQDSTVTDCYNTGDVSGTATGEDSACSVGGVVGDNHGQVTNCYNTGAVRGTATHCSVGGVVGDNSGQVTTCYNTGDVSGTSVGFSCSVGGVVGLNFSTISNCYNTGDVSGTSEGSYCYVGGVVGQNYGDVNTCYNTGSVSSTATYCSVGGVVGDNSGQVTTCYNIGSVTREDATYSVGGVVGQNYGGDVSNCYYLSGKAEIGVGNGNGTAEAKGEFFFKGEDMAEFLNDNQEDGPWEYINEKSAPTLKAFNKG